MKRKLYRNCEDAEQIRKDRGFTLVEMIVVISIFAILLGILVPSLNSVLGFRVQRAADSIAAALDKTKVEAMSRLVGEMELKKEADGYYISFYLDRGKASDAVSTAGDQEKIAPAKTKISYTTSAGTTELQTGNSLILTYDREDGSFRPIQTGTISRSEIDEALSAHKDVTFMDSGLYCEAITVSGGGKTRIIELIQATGKYKITAG